MKKPSSAGEFDPKGSYASVRKQQGKVQSDTDWNEAEGGGGKERRKKGKGPSASGRFWVISLIGLGVLATLTVGLGWVWVSSQGRIPSFEMLPPGSNPILVSLKRPADGGHYPVGGALPVVAQALGSESFTSLELWVDGSLAQTASFPGEDRRYVTGSWDWAVTSLGEHLILVRAVDARGRTGDSNVVRLTGIPDPGLRIRHTTESGDMPKGLAATFGADLAAMLEANPGLTAGQPLPAGAEVIIPLEGNAPPTDPSPPSGPPIPGGGMDPASAAPSPLLFWAEENLAGAAQPPSAPELSLGPAGCSARLFITDTSSDEDGFFVYRIGPGASIFSRLATLGPHSGAGAVAYDVATTGGKNQFYVAAFSTGGEAASNLVAFEAPAAACTSSESGLHLEGDHLVLPQSVDLAYLYYSVDGGPWGRLPADPHTYYKPDHDAVGLTALLQGSNLDLEVWGWKGGSLVFLGTLHTAIGSPTFNFLPVATGPSQFDGCLLSSCAGDVKTWAKEITIVTWGSRDFRWFAPVEGATGGLWQVSEQPFTASCALTPSGLLLSEFVPTTGGVTYFPLDLSPLAPPPSEIDEASPVAQGQPFFPGLPSLGEDSLVEMQADSNGVIPGLGLPAEDGLPRFYVRILPLLGGKPQCQPSNTVIVIYDPTPQPQIIFEVPDLSRFKILYEVVITSYDPPVFPEPQMWGCVQVISLDEAGFAVNSTWTYAEKTGDPVCPESYTGGGGQGFDAFLNDIGAVATAGWDLIADAYNKLDSLVKEFAAKFNPVCIQAQFMADAVQSGEAKTTAEDACKIGTAIAIDAAKAYVGLPPSLPKYGDLENYGKDYLVELAADEFTATTGIPCPAECKDLLREGVDLAFDQLKSTSYSPACVDEAFAHAHGFEPLCPPPGVVIQPAPGAEYTPPVAWLTVRRLPGVEEPQPFPYCSLRISMKVDYHFPGGDVWGPFSPYVPPTYVPAQDVSVLPYQSNGAEIPRLAPGEEVLMALPFPTLLPIVFPWTQKMYVKSQVPPSSFGEDWFTAVRNGTTVISVRTSFREIPSLKAQYGGALIPDFNCAQPATHLAVPATIAP